MPGSRVRGKRGTAKGYLAEPEGEGPGAGRAAGVVGPGRQRPPHGRPLRRGGLRRPRARPLPRRDHRAARRGPAEADGDEHGRGREGDARARSSTCSLIRSATARSARSASAWAAGSRSGPRAKNPEIGAAVTYYYVMPHGKPDFSQIEAPVLGHFGTDDDFISVEDAKALEAELQEAGRRGRVRVLRGRRPRLRQRPRPARHLRRGPRQGGVGEDGRLPQEAPGASRPADPRRNQTERSFQSCATMAPPASRYARPRRVAPRRELGDRDSARGRSR